jgi:LuxR family maltose regulon positive regulatory protein
MARLLYGISSQANDLAPAVSPSYIQRLLAAFPDVEAEQNSQPKNQSSDAEWIEPLTERELEVLQLIANGLTNQDIASKLYLSLNTVKAHTRSIYGKLVVKSRTQAIVRARALGLISSD